MRFSTSGDFFTFTGNYNNLKKKHWWQALNIPHFGQDIEGQAQSCDTDENVNWYYYFGESLIISREMQVQMPQKFQF